MPRIGILTLHYGYNHGAMLQSYATAQLFGGEIIDHRYKSKLAVHERGRRTKPYLRAFLDESLPLSAYQCIAEDFANEGTWKYAESHYDAIVCGSDELWKTNYGSRHRGWKHYAHVARRPVSSLWNLSRKQTDRWCTPFPNVYWPRVSIPTIAFAASAGDTEVAQIPRLHRWRMSRCLERFRLIGVRDEGTKRLITDLAPAIREDVRIVPDPVFSLRPEGKLKESALAKLEANGIQTDRDMAFVHIDKSESFDAEAALAELGYEVVNLPKIALDPLEWFAAIGVCHCGITDAMHPLIASLVNNVPCYSTDTRRKSVELRRDFGVDDYGDIRECTRRWPSDVSEKVAKRRECVFRFVEDGIRVAGGGIAQSYVPTRWRNSGMAGDTSVAEGIDSMH